MCVFVWVSVVWVNFGLKDCLCVSVGEIAFMCV